MFYNNIIIILNLSTKILIDIQLKNRDYTLSYLFRVKYDFHKEGVSIYLSMQGNWTTEYTRLKAKIDLLQRNYR